MRIHWQRWSRGRNLRGQCQGHKKGQGPTSRGQTLSTPRTGILESQAQVFSEKKVSPKVFSGDFQKKETPIFREKSRVLKKKKSSQIFSKVSADFQGNVKRSSWPWPIFNE